MSSIDIDVIKTSRTDIESFESKIFWRGVLIWSVAVLFYFFDNLLNVMPSAMKPQLSSAFNLSAADLGILQSSYLWSYGLMQIPAGLLMDTVGPRRLFTLAGVSCVLGIILFAIADSFLVVCFGRVLIGFGASFAVVGCSKIASVWFTERNFALFMGCMVAVGMFGSAVSLVTVSKIVNVFGMQQTLFIGAVLGFILTVVMWSIIRDKPPVQINSVQTPANESVPILTGLSEVLACRQDWLAAIYAGLMFVPTLAFGGLWGTPYLVEAHGFSQESAGVLSSLVFIGWVFGGPLYGWVSDYIGRRNPPMYFAALTTLTVSLWLVYGSGFSFAGLAIGMFLLGFFSSGFLIAFVVTREKNRPELSGTAIGFMNMMNTFSVAFFQWFIGWLLDFVSTGVIITDNGKHFSLLDYQKALTSIPVCLTLAFIAVLFVKETYCVVKHEEC